MHKKGDGVLESLRQFVENIDPIWQWLGLIAAGAVPYVESYGGAMIGVVAGVVLPVAIVAAIVGNWLSMYALVIGGDRFYKWRDVDETALSDKQKRFKKMFQKYGIPGVSCLGR